jgi:hypothetical protein
MSGGPEDSTPQFPGAEYLKASQTCREGGDSLPPNNQWNVLGALEFLSGKNFHGEPIGFAIIAKLAALQKSTNTASRHTSKWADSTGGQPRATLKRLTGEAMIWRVPPGIVL